MRRKETTSVFRPPPISREIRAAAAESPPPSGGKSSQIKSTGRCGFIRRIICRRHRGRVDTRIRQSCAPSFEAKSVRRRMPKDLQWTEDSVRYRSHGWRVALAFRRAGWQGENGALCHVLLGSESRRRERQLRRLRETLSEASRSAHRLLLRCREGAGTARGGEDSRRAASHRDTRIARPISRRSEAFR